MPAAVSGPPVPVGQYAAGAMHSGGVDTRAPVRWHPGPALANSPRRSEDSRARPGSHPPPSIREADFGGTARQREA